MEQVWLSLAISPELSSPDPRVKKGKSAYGKKKAAMYSRMTKEARTAFPLVGGTYPPEGCFLGGSHSLSAAKSRN